MDLTLGSINNLIDANNLDVNSTQLLEELVGVLTQVTLQARDLAAQIGGFIFK